ncbi:hypothetical protein [Agromyces badenianii]|uniref:hypothetical protein n=1 Tax=Agromyces badenianii TaxID=2080742 RepID=UPI000D59DC1D|nr:hypothetical protein [Agromyces badenianii]PWC04994.1 hypothetical protein DCE94_01365 [Agromyces badenianii]
MSESSDAGSAAPLHTQPSLASRLVRTTFVTEESIYGVILVSGMIVVAGSHGASSWQVFWQVILTVVVFWLAHVYAGTVARHGVEHGRVIGIREAFLGSFKRSLGLVASALIPSFILLLGATKAVDDSVAMWIALWAGVVVLAVLGWIAFARRGSPWPIRLAGAVGTAAFGLAMILMKALIH